MLYFSYDKTFEGLLTCVFDAFYRKERPLFLFDYEEQIPLFSENLKVITDQEKSDRVLNGLKGKISKSAINMLYVCFLSEQKGVDLLIFNYACKAFHSEQSIELNFADPDVLDLSKIYKKVMREAEKIRQFVRFQETADGIYFACIEPQYNVLPLSLDFFEDRFADQPWIIYDVQRKYGYYYDLQKTEEVRFENLNIDLSSGKLSPELVNHDEKIFQDSWKAYLQSITIKERINLKLQRQHMPKRYWKYLIEKQ